jgi:periplasmic protein TonB
MSTMIPSSSPPRTLLWRVMLAAAAVLLLALAVLGIRKLLSEPTRPARQVARIAILPDTPPPPPPPPRERKEEPPKAERPQAPVPDNLVKPPPPSAAEPLKMEGAAGNGPSAFAAGSVSQDYKGGAPTIGSAASGSGGRGLDRAQERLYAGSVRQALRDELERQLQADAGELSAAFALWINDDGRISRWSVDGAEGRLDAAGEAALRVALERSAERLQLPAPAGITQPLRFRLTVRAGA